MSAASHRSMWTLQEAKDRLSAVIHAAEQRGPQTITRHGRPVALVAPITSGCEPTHSAWDLLRDGLVASLGGPPDVPPRTADPPGQVTLPWRRASGSTPAWSRKSQRSTRLKSASAPKRRKR